MHLFLVDEVIISIALICYIPCLHRLDGSQVHILTEPRGSTLEVCISRMKTRASIALRFVLVSATAPNIEDIQAWVEYGDAERVAAVFKVRLVSLVFFLRPDHLI